MKAINVVCPHENKKTEKTYWKQVATAIMDDDLAAYMKEKNLKISIIPNDNPDVNFLIFSPNRS